MPYYKLNIRKNGTGGQWRAFSFTVPREIAELVPEGMEFAVDVDSEGIHYRPVDISVMLNKPEWARQREEHAEA